ncbi:hypothetical protein E4U34_008324 [Claviceps purpurea]|nr:hypothetical protein E4U34_008324 [Claviceps purpurea]KAG6239117.1 hypothetical protein E4U25_001113 [Claviceps purpurea]
MPPQKSIQLEAIKMAPDCKNLGILSGLRHDTIQMTRHKRAVRRGVSSDIKRELRSHDIGELPSGGA